MPKSMQPVLLEAMAFDFLLEYVVRRCKQHSAKGSLNELREGIAFIKEDLCKRMHWQFSMDFAGKFLAKFFCESQPTIHHRIALELLMDTDIVGLRCEGRILSELNPPDAQRFRGLKELNLDDSSEIVLIKLENFQLKDLTTLIFAKTCTDLDLILIGKNCLCLKVLKIPDSKRVTNAGLAALKSCSEIRSVDIVCCTVTHSAINDLLSTHKKLEDFSYGDTVCFRGREVLTHLDSVACPSLKRIYIKSNAISGEPLQPLIVKFLNLTYIAIEGPFTGDLTILKSLNNLKGLELVHGENEIFGVPNDVVTFQSLKELLKIVGERITDLKIRRNGESFYFYQPDLNLIFQLCPNIEYLEFEHAPTEINMVVPLFQKLKKLVPRLPFEFESQDLIDTQVLKFGIMPTLEAISLRDYDMSLMAIEAIMFDSERFPNLRELGISDDIFGEDIVGLMRIAKTNNLDILITDW